MASPPPSDVLGGLGISDEHLASALLSVLIDGGLNRDEVDVAHLCRASHRAARLLRQQKDTRRIVTCRTTLPAFTTSELAAYVSRMIQDVANGKPNVRRHWSFIATSGEPSVCQVYVWRAHRTPSPPSAAAPLSTRVVLTVDALEGGQYHWMHPWTRKRTRHKRRTYTVDVARDAAAASIRAQLKTMSFNLYKGVTYDCRNGMPSNARSIDAYSYDWIHSRRRHAWVLRDAPPAPTLRYHQASWCMFLAALLWSRVDRSHFGIGMWSACGDGTATWRTSFTQRDAVVEHAADVKRLFGAFDPTVYDTNKPKRYWLIKWLLDDAQRLLRRYLDDDETLWVARIDNEGL